MHRSGNRSCRSLNATRFIEGLENRGYLSVSFGDPVNTSAHNVSPATVTLGDLNGDGKSDLVIAGSSFGVSAAAISVGNGDGTFATPTLYPVSGNLSAVAIGDLNHDGHLDVITGSDSSMGVFSNSGNGFFSIGGASDDVLNGIGAIASGDFNNDGNTDLLLVSNAAAASNNAMLVLGDGTGAITAQAPFSLPLGSVSAVAVADFNGDGNLDFVVANAVGNSASVFMGHGNGTFGARQAFGVGFAPTSIAVANFTGETLANGQPKLDIVTADSTAGAISYLANNGDGTFAAAVNIPITQSATHGGPVELAAADFDNDGNVDLAALLSAGGTADAVVLAGNGDGTFSAGSTLDTGGADPVGIAVGDLNGDGLPDVVLAGSSQFTGFLNTSASGLSSSTTTLQPSASTVAAGGSVTLTATVSSTATAAPTGSVEFDIDGNSVGSAVLVGNTAVLTTQLTATGNHSIVAVYTGDTAISRSSSSAVTVNVPAMAPATTPLLPSIARSTLPADVVGGTAVHAAVTVDIANTTGATIKGAVTINLYASADGSVDGTSVLIGSAKRTLSIKAGKEAPVAVPVNSKQFAAATGQYTLLTQVIDPSHNTSSASTGPTLAVAATVIVLTETYSRLNLPNAVVAGSKTPTAAVVKIMNAGNITSAGMIGISFFASTDGTIANGGLINNVSRRLSIRAGQSTTVSVPLKAYPLVPDGNYSIIAQVTDPDDQTSSVSSQNTVNIAAAKIDLADVLVAAPVTGRVGKSIHVALSLSNQGNVTAAGALQITFTGSSSSDGSSAVSIADVNTHIDLKAGGAQVIRIKVPLSTSTPTGDLFLIATVDPDNLFDDVNLSNNIAITATPISLS